MIKEGETCNIYLDGSLILKKFTAEKDHGDYFEGPSSRHEKVRIAKAHIKAAVPSGESE